MKTIICSAFCGTGKTYICENIKKVIEFECWKYDNYNLFPFNYINDIKSQIGKQDIIFISTNPVVLEELNRIGIDITLVYPKKELKKEYLQRYKQRGSSKNFIETLDRNWYNWLEEISNQTYCNHIILDSGEYLLEKLKKYGLS